MALNALNMRFATAFVVEGSHDSNITIRSHTDSTIEISGNPAKFLQGHNIFGTNDLKYLVAKLFDRLCMIDELELNQLLKNMTIFKMVIIV